MHENDSWFFCFLITLTKKTKNKKWNEPDNSYEEVEKDTTENPKLGHNSKEVSGDDDYGYKDYNTTDYYNVEISNGTSAAIICHNDKLSLSMIWLDLTVY